MIKSLEAVFFDIDNTLLDHTTAEQGAVAAIARLHHQTVTPDLFYQTWMETTKEYWDKFERGELTFIQQRNSRIRDIWNVFGSSLSDEQTEGIVVQYLDFYEKNWCLFPDVKGCLQKLSDRRQRLGIVSNGSLDQQRKKLQMTGILGYFDGDLIVVSDEVGVSKPDPQIFAVAQQRAGCLPLHLLYVGDDLAKDIKPAANLSWEVALIDRDNKYEGARLPYRRITDLKNLL